MRYSMLLTILFLILALFTDACKEIDEQPKYQAPDWLEGKLYTQISKQEGLETFTRCLELTGYDTLLDLSGSFTVFAPSNEAFDNFFSENPEYGTNVESIPHDDLQRLVKFHVIQDAWSKAQLQMLNANGWIDPLDEDSEPRAFKRQTMLKEPNRKYWVTFDYEDTYIVDSSLSHNYRIAHTRSRKYVPIFFSDFFNVYDLSTSDYEFYFDRTFESGNIYYAGGKLGDEEIFAENGFIYILDRVIRPFLNAEQLLGKDYPGNESYKTFLDMIYLYPEFEFNREETNNQTEAREGRQYDSLYNLTFPDLPFDVNEELTGPNTTVSKYTYEFHNGLYVPTDEAFQRFLNEVVTDKSGLPHWSSFNAVPNDIKQIIVNTHFTKIPVYESDLLKGFKNASGDMIHIDPSNIIRKAYGSNCTFLGLDQTVMPRAFGSVTGPVYLRPGYSVFMMAMQLSKVMSALSRQDADYSFYPIPDFELALDSSLMVRWLDRNANRYILQSYVRTDESIYTQKTSELAKRIFNQVGTSRPTYSADKEFIETLGGNFIIWDHKNGVVSGAKPNVFGFKGDSLIDIEINELEEMADNGVTFQVNTWFRHSSTTIYGGISAYTYFRDLLQKAELYNQFSYEFPFLTKGEYYTIFIPTEQALLDYGADTLAKEDLAKFLKYHFVRGTRIFTDGKQNWDEYETMRVDESSNEFTRYQSTLNIKPSSDMIQILDNKGEAYITINEEPGKNNIMIATDTDIDESSDTDFITTSVIHVIDGVLVKQ